MAYEHARGVPHLLNGAMPSVHDQLWERLRSPLPPWNHRSSIYVSYDTHFDTTHQSGANARPMIEAHCHTNSQDLISEKKKLLGEKDVGPTCGFTASPKVGPGPLLISCEPSTLTYMLQAKTKGKACTHALPHATAASKPTSLLSEGSSATTCTRAPEPAPLPRRGLTLPRVPSLWTSHLYLWGVWRCHISQGSGPRISA
jgi:hypothetical protein